MGVIAKRLEKYRVTKAPVDEDPLRAIFLRLISNQPMFPSLEVRKKHYDADGELRTEIAQITDQLFEEAKTETRVFDVVNNVNALFKAILKLQLSSMESDIRAKERDKSKMDGLEKQLERADLETELSENQVNASVVTILQQEKGL